MEPDIKTTLDKEYYIEFFEQTIQNKEISILKLPKEIRHSGKTDILNVVGSEIQILYDSYPIVITSYVLQEYSAYIVCTIEEFMSYVFSKLDYDISVILLDNVDSSTEIYKEFLNFCKSHNLSVVGFIV